MDMRMPTRMKFFAASILGLCLAAVLPAIHAQGKRDNQPASNSTDQSAKVASISGTVTSAATGEPLRKARATLIVMGPRGVQPLVALGDSAGHFEIDNIQPGQYTLRVFRDTYVEQQYGQDQPGKPGTLLTLSAGQKLNDLTFRLQKTAAIGGRVVDEMGDPIEHAQIRVMKRTYRAGKPDFDMISDVMSDDHGEYRIFDIIPGRYYVMAFYSQQLMDGARIAYSSVYYPNSMTFEGASPLELKAADEISRIDFSMSGNQTGGYEVSGKVTNAISGKASGSDVVLIPASSGMLRFMAQNTPVNANDGTFKFSSVLPGDYEITATWNENGQRRNASEQITVGNSSVQNLSLVITQGTDITGHVTLQGVGDANNISVILNHAGMNFGPQPRAALQPDGNFALKNVTDGKYNIRVGSPCAHCYVKSATSGGVDLLSGGVQISSDMGPSSIDIVYSGNTAELTGTVTGSGDMPAAGAFIVLIPADDMPNRDDHFETSTTDQYGHFDVSGIVPGRYEVYALDKIDQDAEPFRDPDFLKPFAPKGQSLNLSESDHKSVQLDLVAVGNQ
jgi:protocatechuate 3,4-dioxygenase beta subunit